VGSIQIIGMPDENSAVVKKLSITVRETRAALVVNLFNEPTGKWEPAASTGVPLGKQFAAPSRFWFSPLRTADGGTGLLPVERKSGDGGNRTDATFPPSSYSHARHEETPLVRDSCCAPRSDPRRSSC
jgi:hypothetical protein